MAEPEASHTRDAVDRIRMSAGDIRAGDEKQTAIAALSAGTGEANRQVGQTAAALDSLADRSDAIVGGARPFQLRDFTAANSSASRDLHRDGEVDVTIEFGRTQMHATDTANLRKGSVVALDDLAGAPVDIFANRELAARGEMLVLDGNFCVRVTHLVGRRLLSSRKSS